MLVKITLRRLHGSYAVCRLAPNYPIPAWADGPGFVSISRTGDELSVVCLADRVPEDIHADRDWTCFKFQGPFEFSETGIALSVIRPLSEAGVGIFLVSTFDTDYLPVKSADADSAARILTASGHSIS